MKLGLGTAQFGSAYGISNRTGQTPREEAGKILTTAFQKGVRVLDTAPSYGDSESVLGEFPSLDFEIITKTAQLNSSRISGTDAAIVRDTFQKSLKRLRHEKAEALLLHQPQLLNAEGAERIIAVMEDCKSRGDVKKIGVSVYTAAEIDRALELFKPDIIQVPFNVADQRLLKSGHLEKMKQHGVEIHVRSVFLQGILLISPDMLPEHFADARDHLTRYREALDGKKLSPLGGAIDFLKQQAMVDVMLIGVTTLAEFLEVFAAFEAPASGMDYSRFALENEEILNPAKWKVTA